MKTILVPTDFSPTAEEAAKLANSIAIATDANLHFVHIVEESLFQHNNDEITPERTDILPLEGSKLEVKTVSTGEERIQGIIDDLKSKFPRAEFHIEYGDVSTKVIEAAKKVEATLIVLGTNGASGLKEEFIGSNAQKINRFSPIPTLSVRHFTSQYFAPKKMVYASDFEEERTNAHIINVKAVANLFEADLKYLFVNTPHQFKDSIAQKRKFEKLSEQFDIEMDQFVNFDHLTVEDGILSYSKEFGADLLMVSTHDYASSGTAFLEFKTTEWLINHSKVPVLSIPTKE